MSEERRKEYQERRTVIQNARTIFRSTSLNTPAYSPVELISGQMNVNHGKTTNLAIEWQSWMICALTAFLRES